MQTEVAVVGAGVVGLAVALELADAGHDVTLIDPEPPGSGASFGNAGTIADYAVMPVGTPEVLRDLPRLLLDRDSPLAIRRSSALALVPWLLRFLRESRPSAAARNARVLSTLLADAGPRWAALVQRAGAGSSLQRRGALYVYTTAAERAASEKGMAARRALGVAVEMIDAATLAAMEPGLPPMAGGAWFPQATFLDDPGAVMARLAATAEAAGVRRVVARVSRIERAGGGVRLGGPDIALTARHVVVAAGAHSRALAAMAGDRVPLDTERGYHVEWDMPAPPVTRPTSLVARGLYLCPMAGRLRVAGTVELGGIAAPPSPHRWAVLERGARVVMPGLGPPDRRWMGLRPSMPDSLPVIGASRGGPEVIHAFGHGHLGVTLAPVTAAAVAALVAGRAPPVDLAPLAPGRF